MTAAAPTETPTIRLVVGRCRDCGAAIAWTLLDGKRVALDLTPIAVIRFDRNLVDVKVWKHEFARILTDQGEQLGGWHVGEDVRPDLPRVVGRTGHWGNCWPNDPIGREVRLERRERIEEQRSPGDPSDRRGA